MSYLNGGRDLSKLDAKSTAVCFLLESELILTALLFLAHTIGKLQPGESFDFVNSPLKVIDNLEFDQILDVISAVTDLKFRMAQEVTDAIREMEKQDGAQ